MADSLKDMLAKLPAEVKERLNAYVEEQAAEGVDPAEACAAFAEKNGVKVAVAEVKKLFDELSDDSLEKVVGGLALGADKLASQLASSDKLADQLALVDKDVLASLARFKEGLAKLV
ncbi:MAG: hypothetical protein K6G78_02635 [bacterium]|nr:hypothetical protein [bacterium]